ASFAVMRPDVAALLQQRLRREPDRLRAAWKVIERVHRDSLPIALRTEEQIAYRVLADPDDPEIDRLFDSILSALNNGRAGLARWAARALPRLPTEAWSSVAAWSVASKATEMIGGPSIVPAEAAPVAIRNVTRGAVSRDLPRVEIGLRLFDNALRVSEPPEPGAVTIGVPDTTPLMLEVSWEAHGSSERRTIAFMRGSTQIVRSIGPGELRVTPAALEAFGLVLDETRAPVVSHRADAREGELTVSAYRGDAPVLLAWDMAENRRAGLHGFSVARVEP